MSGASARARRLGALARAAALGVAILLLGVAGCGRQTTTFEGSDVTGTTLGRDFALTDHNGMPRTLADFRGKVVVLFFGYTHCPDVCPTTLAELAQAMQDLGPDAKRVQVLFATVDPDRDTQDLLARYVPAFNPTFLGLRGDAEATARATKEFKIVVQKQPGPTPDSYTVDHSAGTFIFDPQGHLRVYVGYGQGPQVFEHDIRALLASDA